MKNKKPINTKETDIYELLREAVLREEPVLLAKVIAADSRTISAGATMLIFADGRTAGNLAEGELERQVIRDASDLLLGGKARTGKYRLKEGKSAEVYLEPYPPPPRLLIFGADPDSRPIVQLGDQLGFNITLVDHRPAFANGKVFPGARKIIVARPEELAGKVDIDEKTFVLVKTHLYQSDKEILKFVLPSPARYIGQMGPRARTDDLLQEIKNESMEIEPAMRAKLYAPVGLDIGAEAPEEIALSIMAEILAVLNAREGESLRRKDTPIHCRPEQ